MDAPEYRRLADHHEQLALADPASYRRSLRRFALLGRTFPLLYAAIVLAIVAGIAALIATFGGGGIILAKVGWIVIPILFVTLRSLFVRVPQPEGLRVTRKQAPQLHAMIDELSEAAQTAPPDRVLLVDEFNAAVAEVPRVAMIGGFRRYLLIGMPLLAALSPDELRSVIAHELGHVSGRHGREGVLVFRVFQGWRRIWNDLEGKAGANTLLRFGHWYLPRLEARSFAMRRQQEIEADELARDLVGGRTAATAMLRLVIESGRSERFARDMWHRRLNSGEIGEGWSATLLREFRRPFERPARARMYLADQLLVKTTSDDEHPALADRLRTLGMPVTLAPDDEGMSLDEAAALVTEPPAETAAERYLGDRAVQLAAQVDAAVERDVRESMKRLQEDDAELQQLEGAEGTDEQRDLQRLAMSMALRPEADVTRFASELVTRYPESAAAHFHQGSALIATGDERGVEYLRRAMELDPAATVGACRTLRGWHAARGEVEQARDYDARAQEREEAQERAAYERRDLTDTVELDPPNLPERLREAISSAAAHHPRLADVYVARQRVRWLPDEPQYLVALRMRDFEDDDVRRAVEDIAGVFAPACHGMTDFDILLPGASTGGFDRVLDVDGARVYSRDAAASASPAH